MKIFALSILVLASSAISSPAIAETIYLLIKSESSNAYIKSISVSLHSLPMESVEQCEEAGALIIASERLDTKYATRNGFECIVGK